MAGGLGVDRVTTARLVGRRPQRADVGAWTGWFTDPRVDEAAWPSSLRTPERAVDTFEAALRHWERWGFGQWIVEAEGTPVGKTGLQHARIGGRPEVELMWFFGADHWNRGYATEMAREAVRVAFEVLELNDVVAFTTPANAPSQAVMRKLGMTFDSEIVHAGLPHLLFRLSR